jgi:hypothetical protein
VAATTRREYQWEHAKYRPPDKGLGVDEDGTREKERDQEGFMCRNRCGGRSQRSRTLGLARTSSCSGLDVEREVNVEEVFRRISRYRVRSRDAFRYK